jgi:uncharacterized protein
MFRKEDVRFPVEGGIELSAWLFVPERQTAPLPAITMSHGYGGTKYHSIEPMAEAFAAAGFVVLLHDHRGFGDSGGEPRNDINPWQQITDWRRAISYLHHTTATDLSLKAYARALEPKWLVMIKGGHFDPYLSEFETASSAAIDWFKAHL